MRTAGEGGFDSYLASVVESNIRKPETLAAFKAVKDKTYSADKAENSKQKSKARLAFLESIFDGASEAAQEAMLARAQEVREEAQAAREARKAKDKVAGDL